MAVAPLWSLLPPLLLCVCVAKRYFKHHKHGSRSSRWQTPSPLLVVGFYGAGCVTLAPSRYPDRSASSSAAAAAAASPSISSLPTSPSLGPISAAISISLRRSRLCAATAVFLGRITRSCPPAATPAARRPRTSPSRPGDSCPHARPLPPATATSAAAAAFLALEPASLSPVPRLGRKARNRRRSSPSKLDGTCTRRSAPLRPPCIGPSTPRGASAFGLCGREPVASYELRQRATGAPACRRLPQSVLSSHLLAPVLLRASRWLSAGD